MILIDTGPLIALIDAGQGEIHTRCLETQRNIQGSLFTPGFKNALHKRQPIRV